ncbi:ubiquitin-conjugating enzyme E2 G1 isoform X2 [Eptesicus fuscus]|uniref:ubiquitin-conjugating enzyme E2 G1 isoform X2 n=1 Tax=Eptesicus fuscus TaxID=29078 RepID=UPI002403F503|nr:ubiquitin-conjugating enzyme E2 G1 isoform X2 [Eptesicus fuscus]
MAATRANARQGRGPDGRGGAGRHRGRAFGPAEPEGGSPSAPARSGPARSEAVAGEGTGGADPRAEGGKQAGEIPARAAAARVPSPSGREAVRSAEAGGLAPAARRRSRRPSPASFGFGAPAVGPGFLSTPSSGRLRACPWPFARPGASPGPRREDDGAAVGTATAKTAGSEGGVFKAHLTFPKDYPLRPPKMKFITEIWHPNVDKNGDVCISILHEPGEDKYGYEKPEERWLPIHTVETIMISVISMLADPNGDSPANVDAAKEWREDRNGEFKRKVARCVRKSQETAFE